MVVGATVVLVVGATVVVVGATVVVVVAAAAGKHVRLPEVLPPWAHCRDAPEQLTDIATPGFSDRPPSFVVVEEAA